MNDPIPTETSDPIPAASMPGTNTVGSLGPPIPVASISITAAISGDSKMNDSAAKAPQAAINPDDLVGSVLSHQPDRQDREPAAQRQQRRLRPEHEAESDRGDGRQHDARQVDRLGTAGVQTLGRHVAPVTRQPHDRKRDHQSRECAHREVPPQRRPVLVTDCVRQVLVDPLRQVVHELKKAP